MVVTISLSLMTAPPTKESLEGLVYRRAAIKREPQPWYRRVGFQGALILAAALILNFLFW